MKRKTIYRETGSEMVGLIVIQECFFVDWFVWFVIYLLRLGRNQCVLGGTGGGRGNSMVDREKSVVLIAS